VDLDKQGRTEEAIQSFKQALQRQPGYVAAWNNLGTVLNKTGRLDEAINDYEQALQLDPEKPETHKYIGEVLDKTGQTDAAVRHYQTALRLNPAYAEAHNNLGVDFARQGRFAEAADQFQQALQARPDYTEAGNNLGYLWTEQGEHLDEALALIQHAHKVDPKSSDTLDSLAWVLFKLNRPAEGLDYARQAIQDSPRPNASLYDHLGDIYAALHQHDQAAGAWRQSLVISPSPEVRKKLDGAAGP
jgi:tetratricopeptide (TPR) repeat protein